MDNEWIMCNLSWYAYGSVEENISNGFCNLGLNKTGTLIEIEVDGVLLQYLIGDINNQGGCCDDCMMFDNSAVVYRYKIIWRENG